jgi:mannose-6-phosphate isomerase-like protein (cupin superfamily)
MIDPKRFANDSTSQPVLVRRLVDYPVFRVKGASNRFVLVVNPFEKPLDYVTIIEIFDVGGRTPPNTHQFAWESFFVLYGEGTAQVAGQRIPLSRGDSLLLTPGTEHVIENTGRSRLYCMTTMVPDENFAALILSGLPDHLDAEDIAILTAS